MTAEIIIIIKKKNPEILNFEYLVQFTHSYHLKRTKAFIFLFSLFCVAFGLWCEFTAGNIVLGAPLNLFSLVAVRHHLVNIYHVTAIDLEAQLESLKN